jgi:undecaprenyl-diphosphatase
MAVRGEHSEAPVPTTSDTVIRGLTSMIALGVADVLCGRALKRRPGLEQREREAILRLQARRAPNQDAVARTVSTISDVPASVLHGVAALAVLRRVTGSWRIAATPALALALEAATYVTVGALVQRDRPDVPRWDHDQPTSSFPSGHVGAAVALAVVYARLGRDVRSPLLRAALVGSCVVSPAVLGWSRVYVGMHYPSDVAGGVVTGLASGLVAWECLHPRGQPAGERGPRGRPAPHR